MQAHVRLFFKDLPEQKCAFFGVSIQRPLKTCTTSIFFCDGDEIDDDDLEGNSTIVGVKQFVLDWMEDRTISWATAGHEVRDEENRYHHSSYAQSWRWKACEKPCHQAEPRGLQDATAYNPSEEKQYHSAAEVGWPENRKWCRVPFDRMIVDVRRYLHISYIFFFYIYTKKIFDIFTLTQPYQSLTFESEGLNQHRNALLYIHTDAIYIYIAIYWFIDTCMFVLFNM